MLNVGGNQKLGPGIASSFLPPGLPAGGGTCAGATDACLEPSVRSHTGQSGKSEVCYWVRLLKVRPVLDRAGRRRLALYRKSPQEWEDRIVAEVEAMRPVAVRWNVGGDIMDASMARHVRKAMERLARASRRSSHPPAPWWLYTRSWIDLDVRAQLALMAELPHVHVWWSVDRDNHVRLPERTAPFRLAWMATRRDEEFARQEAVARCDLVFLDDPVAKALARENNGAVPRTFAGVPVCPHDWNPAVTCRSCGICWRKRELI